MDRLDICDFYGCRNEISLEESENSPHMRFCDEHLAQFDALVEKKNYPVLIRWWIKARGGKKRVIFNRGIYQSHELARQVDSA